MDQQHHHLPQKIACFLKIQEKKVDKGLDGVVVTEFTR
jgi:hypothetical protein